MEDPLNFEAGPDPTLNYWVKDNSSMLNLQTYRI